MGKKRCLASRALLFVCSSLAASTSNAGTRMQSGWVRSDTTPMAHATVSLYVAGSQRGAGAVVLGSAPADKNGYFCIRYAPPAQADAVLYLVADGPAATTRLATVLGVAPFPEDVTINERTTVATAYALAQFINGAVIGGTSPGLQNAAGTFRNLIELETGEVGDVLGSAPNGLDTSTLRAFNALANILAGCVSSAADCVALFDLATPPGGKPPHNTLDAAVNIAHFPWQNANGLFLASLIHTPYQPALSAPPQNWALAIKYVGNGREFDGPGNAAFDAAGDVWISNNYVFRHNHNVPTCGGMELLKLTATGRDAPGAPYNGRHAGLAGQGFGVTIDPLHNVWVGSFGFFGSTCPPHLRPPANAVSKFAPDGTPLSPRGGFTQNCIAGPQGTVSDEIGNIWIANTCGGTVTQYRAGNPNDAWVFDIDAGQLSPPGECPTNSVARPFAIAIDADGNAWVTDNGTNNAFKLSPSGVRLAHSGPGTGIHFPLGVAIDSVGNVWISNSAIINPCLALGDNPTYGVLTPDPANASVTKLDSDGAWLGTFTGGGISIPWGIAVDGADDVWVADFAGQRVTQLDGATGQPIAPDGYHNDALMRNTAVTIDSSGNVWLCNNWLIDAVQTNPGGDGMVVFIGLAAPVRTPMFGPPRQP